MAMTNKLAHIRHQKIHLWFFYKPLDGLLMYKPWFTNWTQTVKWISIFSLASLTKPIFSYLWPGTFKRWQWPTNWKRAFVVSYISMAVKITHIFLPWFFYNWRRGVVSSRESEFLTLYSNNERKSKRCLILLHIFGFGWAKRSDLVWFFPPQILETIYRNFSGIYGSIVSYLTYQS